MLVPHEVDELFASLRQLTGSKATVIFISHKLDEVLALRRRDHRDPRRQDGRRGRRPVVGDRRAARRDDGRLASCRRPRRARARSPTASCSRSATSPSSPAPTPATSPSASRRAPTCSPALPAPVAAHRPLDGVSIEVHAGEIVGIAGVEGNGQTELIDAIIGLVPATGTSRSTATTSASCRRSPAASAGIGYIPEDRQRDGMVLAIPLWENVLLGHQSSPDVQRARPDRPRRLPPARRRDRPRLRRAHAEHRRAGVHAVGRQPAEADRRAGDDWPSRRC